MKPFQAALLVIFGVLALGAVFVFATFSSSGGTQTGPVVIWGTLPSSTVQEVLQAAKQTERGYDNVSYQFVAEDSFSSTLVEAIAAGRGPDLVLLPASSVMGDADKLQPISYRSITRRNFQDVYIEAGEVFLTDDGILGLPFYIDPYVLYWNRTLFSSGGVARAPKYWDEVSDIAPRLSQKTSAGTLTQSAVALGEWENIPHAKDIFVSLVKGLGNDIVETDSQGEPLVTLARRSSAGVSAGESALRFYSDFSDPVQAVFSWSRSQPESRDAFTGGTLAVYLGKASEVSMIRAANPNLNFDIANYPQVRDGRIAVPAALYGLAIPRGSGNPSGALQVAVLLAGVPAQEALITETGLPSVRRDVLSSAPENPYESIFRDAALNAFVFRDPNPKATDAIFERMMESVSSGKFNIPEAVQSAQGELEALIGRVQ